MAHYEKVLAGKSSQSARSSHRTSVHEEQAYKDANGLQVELSERACLPAGIDALQHFDSSMSKGTVQERFQRLVEYSREAVYA